MGNSGPENTKNFVITYKMPEKVIFTPCRRIPWSKITKLTLLILLDGLHLYFNFGEIWIINDGFITKIILVLKT